jgi:hypothetical protein
MLIFIIKAVKIFNGIIAKSFKIFIFEIINFNKN